MWGRVKESGIKKEGHKTPLLVFHGFDIHFDDDYMEVNNIISNCKKCKAIQVYDTFQDE